MTNINQKRIMSDNDNFFGGPQVLIHRLEGEVSQLKADLAASKIINSNLCDITESDDEEIEVLHQRITELAARASKADAYIEGLKRYLKESLLRECALEDELNWVYDHSNEQHIRARVAAVLPPEDR